GALRCDGLCRLAARARDRSSHGAWRAIARHSQAGYGARTEADARWIGAGNGGRVRADARYGAASIRSHPHRSADVHPDLIVTCGRGLVSLLDPLAAGGEG